MSSAVSNMLEAGIIRHILPILGRIGMSLAPNVGRVKPGLVSRTLSMPLERGRAFILQCWCEGKVAHGLTWRLDALEGDIWHSLQFAFPFERIGMPPGPSEGGSHSWLQEFHPHLSVERFDRAMACMGGFFALVHPQIAAQLPELESILRAAAASQKWRAASEQAPRLWANRHVEGDIDATDVASVVVFAGANLVVLDAGGTRITFRFPVQGIKKGDAAQVSGWWTTPAGTRSATVLAIASRVWRFDVAGRLVASE